jgi:hypothetical protein
MTLKSKEFHAMRLKAIKDTKDRTFKRTRVEFEILEEIAKTLKTTSQVASMIFLRLTKNSSHI